jgi:hypothetical protein
VTMTVDTWADIPELPPLGPNPRRLASLMVATMLAGSHHTEPCVAEDKQIANAVRVALKIIRAIDEAA